MGLTLPPSVALSLSSSSGAGACTVRPILGVAAIRRSAMKKAPSQATRTVLIHRIHLVVMMKMITVHHAPASTMAEVAKVADMVASSARNRTYQEQCKRFRISFWWQFVKINRFHLFLTQQVCYFLGIILGSEILAAMEIMEAKEDTFEPPKLTGDQIALFDQLERKHHRDVYNAAYRLTGNGHDAEDLTQEAFIQAYRSFGTYNPNRPFMSWMARVVRNKAIDIRRRNKKLWNNVSIDSPIEGDENDLVREFEDKGPGTQELALNNLSAEELLKLLSEVPEAYRVTVLLADVEEKSYEEIAEATGVSIGTVRSRIHRGRKAFRRLGLKLEKLEQSVITRPTRQQIIPAP